MKKLYRFLRKWWNGRQTAALTLHGSGHSFTECMDCSWADTRTEKGGRKVGGFAKTGEMTTRQN